MIPTLKTIAQALALVFIIVITAYALLLIYGVLSGGEVARLSDTEKLTLAISIFSSAGALFAGYAAWKANKLSESEAKANREHNINSLRPLLSIQFFIDEKNRFVEFLLINSGNGPAEILSLNMLYSGCSIDSSDMKPEDWKKIFYFARKIDSNVIKKFPSHLSSLSEKQLLKLTLSDDGSDDYDQLLNSIAEQIKITIRYQDLYKSGVKELTY